MGVEAVRGTTRNDRTADEITVGPLLARAKLMRQRAQWDESIAVCTEALRRCPDSVTAHSLLGEIYESMGRLDDASQWYAMAVERAPGDIQEKAKLERTLMAQQAQRPVVLKAQTAPALPVREKTLGRTLQWFDRVFPPGKADSIARLIFAVSGILAALLLLSAAIVFFAFRQSAGQTSAAIGGSELLPTVGEPLEPIIVMPRASSEDAPAKSGAFLTSAPSESASGAPVLAPPKPAPPMEDAATVANRVASVNKPGANAKAGETDDPDAELRLSIARATGVSVVNVPLIRRDARGRAIGVEVTLPRGYGEPEIKTKRRVLLAAAEASQAITQFDANTQYAAVRISLSTPSSIPGGAPYTEIAFRGDCELTEVRNADTRLMTLDELLNRFTSIAWGEVFGGPPTTY